jgi:hypothetical protein
VPEPQHDTTTDDGDDIEVSDAHRASVGPAEVRRLLPRRQRRTVGPWCFLDHFGPNPDATAAIGPHPHMGLQTVTWLLEGELLHKDTLGSEQVIRPGQLNLMSAGHGIAHAEERSPTGGPGGHGTQLWVAQPDATRNGPPAFEHHAELLAVDLAGADGHVLVGTWAGVTSPARADTPQVGIQLLVHGRANLPLDAAFEHAIAPLDGPITVDGRPVALDRIAYLPPGRAELTVESVDGPGRVLLLGGAPWDVRISMWWNFVGRDHAELTQGFEDWQRDDGRFGTVASDLARIAAPRPPWLP